MKLKQSPDDFVVEERTDVAPGADGAFALYRLDKVGWTTPDAVAAVRRPGDGVRPVRGGAPPRPDGPLRTRPGGAEAGEGHPDPPLGRLAGVQGRVAAWARPQPRRLPAYPPDRLPRGGGPAPARTPGLVPVRVPEPPLEPHARPVADHALPPGRPRRRPAEARDGSGPRARPGGVGGRVVVTGV